MNEKKQFIEQLRKLSRIGNKERTWISDLSDERIYEIRSRLLNGESARDIARHVQQVWQINPSSSIHSIAQGITKFRRRISHLLIMSPPTANATCDIDPDRELVSENASTRMERMALEAESRIKSIMAEEKQTGIKYAFLHRDIQALTNLRKSVLKQREWEFQHADLIQAENRKNIEKNIKDKFDRLLVTLGDDGQERIINMTTRFLEEIDKLAVPMVCKADGEWVIVDENK